MLHRDYRSRLLEEDYSVATLLILYIGQVEQINNRL